MYRTYIRTFDQRVLDDTKTATPDRDAAASAFAALVNRSDLDGQKYAAVLSYNNRQLAFHRFDRAPGDADYWRDKLDEIEWPEHGGARPGAGRPPVESPKKNRTLRASDEVWTWFLAQGGGKYLEQLYRDSQESDSAATD